MTFLDDFDGLDETSNERIRPEMKNLIARGNVTVEEIEDLRCNSWEWEALVPVMNDEAFVKQMQRALDNCFTTRTRPFSTYNDAVEGLYAPELLRRYKMISKKVEDLAEEFFKAEVATPEHPHLIHGEFQSDKYPTTPRGKVPLSTRDIAAQDLLWEYAQRRRRIDPQFSADLEIALRGNGYEPEKGVRLDHEGRSRTPDGFINNCALANHDEEKNCQVCFGRCPDRERFETP